MGVKAVFEQISKNEGISIDEIAKVLGVAKSTLYYSINKDSFSLKLKKAIKEKYPNYLEIKDEEETGQNNFDPIEVVDYIVTNEEELLKVDKFRLWLQTKVQDGVIDILSIKKNN